ncbi:MAG: hypothetical protein JJE50_01535 [Actinomycetales bacterium]|nr:hypothetical protein [Actinomycetales bacterium]
MRAITVRQPHAWAIVHLGKVENRTRNIAGSYRGPVAIHAGLHPFEQDNMSSRAHRDAHGSETPTEIAFGAIIGVADLVDVHHADECWDRELHRVVRLYREHRDEFAAIPDNGAGGILGRLRPCSPWAMDEHWHLVWENPRPLAVPIPAKGRLGLWTLPDDIAEQVTS